MAITRVNLLAAGLTSIKVKSIAYSNPSAVSIGPSAGEVWIVESILCTATDLSVNPVIDVGINNSETPTFAVKLANSMQLKKQQAPINLILGRPLYMEEGCTVEIDTISGDWDILINIAQIED